jgi:uncharacterized protein (DUF1499 family)
MFVPRISPLAVLILSVSALLLLAVAPLGWRLGWWQYRFALYWLMPASGLVAAIAVTLGMLTIALRWPELGPSSVASLAIALVLGLVLIYVPYHYYRMRRIYPPIHDITTDTDNPPRFSAVLPARAAEHAGSVAYDNPRLPGLQKAAYPEVAPLKAALPVAAAFDAALSVATSMPGWTIVASDRDAGRIEASQQSRWFRFTDDMVIRIACDEVGSRIDVRSTSRQGRSDFGVNAARIRAYMSALRKRVG